MHWPRIHLPPGYHRNQRIVRPMLPPGVVGQWRGPNLLVDGDMEDLGVSAWTVANGTMTKETGSPKQGGQLGRITQASSTSAYIRQSGITSYIMYRLSGWVRITPISDACRIYGDGDPIWIGSTTPNVWEYFDFLFMLQGTYMLFYSRGPSGAYAEFDDLYMSEETVPANRFPDGTMEGYGIGSWPLTSATGSTEKITTNPYAGIQALRVTRGTGVSHTTTYGLTSGIDYRMTGYARSCGNCIPNVFSGATRWTGNTSTDWQSIDVTWTSNTTALRLETTSGGVGGYSDWDSLLLVEV